MTEGTASKRTIGEPGPEAGAKSGLNRRTFTQAAIGTAAAVGAASLARWSAIRHGEHAKRGAAENTRRIMSTRVADALPIDPTAAAWKNLAALDVPLKQQYMVAPRLQPEGMIPALSLRSMHNGKEIGFHVSWGDSGQNDLEVVGHFRDSVAVQLPVDPAAPVMVVMGQPGRPVHVLHWRASWQRVVKNGPRTVRDAFPNAYSDVSPDDLMKPEQARAYYPSLVAGNPMATRERTSPIEELVAQGYGSITSQAQQRAQGGGVYANGRWDVAIIIPMTGGENLATLTPGDLTHVALAVWNGGKGDRGARKQFADWIALEVAR